MAYDRQGRKAAAVQLPDADEQIATPNAARVQGGHAVRGRAPARRAAGKASAPQEQRQAGTPRKLVRRSGAFVRVLPVVVVVALFLMGVKVVGIWDVLKNGKSPVSVAAFAEADSPAPSSDKAENTLDSQQLAQATEPAKGDDGDKPLDPVLCVDTCLLYTSDAADDLLCVDLGGRRIIKKKKTFARCQNT
eukprot:TRINITY_DN2023_c0_g1_i1.p1 TRINITY_DN2023_c0_g1~~TRINITY_DN2023_c0_g1_i1.p1  ORF type:complete len:191 (-),score=21.86 TRINITY_DN2023_c0_g1_i1:56-628(-)